MTDLLFIQHGLDQREQLVMPRSFVSVAGNSQGSTDA